MGSQIGGGRRIEARNYLRRLYFLESFDDRDNTICDFGFVEEWSSDFLGETTTKNNVQGSYASMRSDARASESRRDIDFEVSK